MVINILTLFPEMFDSFLSTSIIKRAIEKELVTINLIDFRAYADNKQKRVDDTAYGGGSGMVLSVEPIHKCLNALNSSGKVIALTPTGEILNDQLVDSLKQEGEITLICGHYEGFDERVYNYCDYEVSIGDFVLTGGETAAYVIIDTVVRKIPGVIKESSVENESFSSGILDYPVYTKPISYDGHDVPDVLLSGNHQAIAKYRYKEALKKTYLKRNDLIVKNHSLINEEVLKEIIDELEESE